MIRNPLVAVLTLSFLTATGCGAARVMAPSKMTPARMSPMAALAAEKREFPVTPDADKDWVVVTGKVTKLLPDDNNGSRHQHFLFKTDAGKTIKTAHNIDLAPYVPVKVGGEVEVKCEYIRSKPNDVAHWTHYDPRGGEGGYIKYEGKVYDRLPEAQ